MTFEQHPNLSGRRRRVEAMPDARHKLRRTARARAQRLRDRLYAGRLPEGAPVWAHGFEARRRRRGPFSWGVYVVGQWEDAS